MCKNAIKREEIIQFDERLRELENTIAYLKGVLRGLLIGMTILVIILRVFLKDPTATKSRISLSFP